MAEWSKALELGLLYPVFTGEGSNPSVVIIFLLIFESVRIVPRHHQISNRALLTIRPIRQPGRSIAHTMADSSSSTSSSPSLPASTPPSSVPSPEIQNLSLSETPRVVSDEDKAEALKLKAEANKAFISEPTRFLSTYADCSYARCRS